MTLAQLSEELDYLYTRYNNLEGRNVNGELAFLFREIKSVERQIYELNLNP